ncbi:MAG: nitroreductase family protein [Candidatus Eremiobacterota bacterium]
MEFKEVLEHRTSVRAFTSEEVKIEDLKEIVRYAGLAPSVNNSQPWRFIAITNKERLKKMGDLVLKKIDNLLPASSEEEEKVKSKVISFSTFFVNAPSVVAVAMKPYEAVVDTCKTDITHEEMNRLRGYPDILSLGAAIENLILGSVNLGYGSCWLSGPLVAREELEECLSVKSPWKLAAMVAIGKPSVHPKKSEKKPLDEIFEFIS